MTMGKMLVLRLQRTGRRNNPAFRLVVTEKSAPVKGKVKEYLGHYLPTRNSNLADLIRNTGGTAIGCLLALIGRGIWRRLSPRG